MVKEWAEEALALFELNFHPQRKEMAELHRNGISWRRIASLYPFEPSAYPPAITRSLRRSSSGKVRALLVKFDHYSEALDQELRDLIGDNDPSIHAIDPYFFDSSDPYKKYLIPAHRKALGIIGRRILDDSENHDYTGFAFSLYALPRTLHNVMRLGGVDALPAKFDGDLAGLQAATEATIRQLRLK